MKQELYKRLAVLEQQQLLAFWDELSEHQQRTLADQIRAVDFALVERLFGEHSGAEDWSTIAARATPPPAARLSGGDNPFSKEQASARGRQALAAG